MAIIGIFNMSCEPYHDIDVLVFNQKITVCICCRYEEEDKDIDCMLVDKGELRYRERKSVKIITVKSVDVWTSN